jgi:hypothetical protein
MYLTNPVRCTTAPRVDGSTPRVCGSAPRVCGTVTLCEGTPLLCGTPILAGVLACCTVRARAGVAVDSNPQLYPTAPST